LALLHLKILAKQHRWKKWRMWYWNTRF